MKRLIAFLTIPIVIFILCGIAVSDSYTGGGGASTLQKVVEKGNTGSLTTDNTMELTATSTYEGLSIDHGLGAGFALEITGHAGTGEMIYAERAGSDGTGKVAWFYSEENADVFEVDSLGNGDGIYISKPSGAGAALNISNVGTGNAVSIASSLNGAGSDKAAIYSWALGANQEALFLDKGANSGNSITAQTNISGYIKTFQVGSEGNITAGRSGTTGSVLDTTNIFYGLTDDSTGGMKLTNTHNDASGINLIFDRAPADGGSSGDVLSNVVSYGLDASGTSDVMAKITATLTDNASGTEDAEICFSAMVGGVLTEIDCLGDPDTNGSAMTYMGFATGTDSVSVATGTAPNGVVVAFGAHIYLTYAGGNDCGIYVPLSVNGVDLSTSGAPDVRYHVFSQDGGSADAHNDGNFYTQTVYATADGWNPNIMNTVEIGTDWATGSCLPGATSQDYTVSVIAIK